MIRINLLGQTRPKAAKTAVPVEATVQVIFAVVAIGVALAVLGITYMQQRKELDQVNARIASLRAERASLQQIKQEVDRFESQKAVLQQRIDVIETLQKNRTGGQDLLQMVANTVLHADSVWLTTLNRSGNSIDMQGEAASINAVANFITQLKRSGYFDNVEIKTAAEDDIVPSVSTFGFSMTASISPQPTGPQPAGAQPKAQPTGATQPPPQPAKGGRS
jgi:type IV pilus assembly protein PilN